MAHALKLSGVHYSVHYSIIEKSFVCLRFVCFKARFLLMIDDRYANR